MDQIVYEIKFPGRAPVLLKIWLSDNPAASMGCDACIGYSVHDAVSLSLVDGGEMDYDSDEKEYNTAADARDDVIDFAFDGMAPERVSPSDVDPDDLED